MERKRSPYPLFLAIAAVGLAFSPCTSALARRGGGGGGAAGSNGLVPRLEVVAAPDGAGVRIRVDDLAGTAGEVYIGFAREYWGRSLPPRFGEGARIIPRIEFDPAGEPPLFPSVEVPGTGPVREADRAVPEPLRGTRFWVQAFVRDPGVESGWALSDGARVWSPLPPIPEGGASTRIAGTLPSGRIYTASVLDPATRTVYVFGGWQYRSFLTDEIVEVRLDAPLDGHVSVLEDRLPVRRYGIAAVWDPERGVAYLFGGCGPDRAITSDVMEFDPSRPPGERLRATADLLPTPRYRLASALDAASGRIFLFGGIEEGGTLSDEILSFDPAAQEGSRIEVLSDRVPATHFSMGAARLADAIYLVGAAPGYRVARFRPGAAAGQRIEELADSIDYRAAFAMAADTHLERFYVLGGHQSGPMDTIVAFDPARPEGERVSEEATLPEPVYGLSTVYDPAHRVVLSFGGYGEEGYCARVSFFDPGRGVTGICAHLPSGRRASGIFWPDDRRFFVIGGASWHEHMLDEIVEVRWEGSIEKHVRILEDRLPERRYGVCAVWDPERERAFLFGGRGPDGAYLDEILELTPSAPPGERIRVLADRLEVGAFNVQGAYDETSGLIHLFGGVEEGGPNGAIYAFDPAAPEGARLERLPDTAPAPHFSLRAAALEGRTLLFGAASEGRILGFAPQRPSGSRIFWTDDVYEYRASYSACADPARRSILLIGGSTSGPQTDIFAYVPRADSGEPAVRRIGDLPNPRVDVSSAPVPGEGGVAIAAGGFDYGMYYRDIVLISGP